jgi:hypothetical protein
VLKLFQDSKTIKFYDEVIFFRKTCLLDSLKELLLIRNIMTFVDTQQHFVDVQQHFADTQQHFVLHNKFLRILMFADTQQLYAHLDICCYTGTFC